MESANAMQLFVSVVEAGSFAAAARTLGVPTSTVSRRVNRLEERLDCLLLQRSTRKLAPTPVGRAYYLRCKQIVADIVETENAVASMQSEPRGRLRVAAPPDGGFGLLAELIPQFLIRYPEVEIDVVAGTRFVDLVAEGFDVALRAGTLTDSSLIARRLLGAEHGAVASVGYADLHGLPTSLEELSTHTCMVAGAGYGLSRWPLRAGGWVEVPARVRTNELAVIYGAVMADLGIACVPLPLLHEELQQGRAVRVLPELVGSVGGLYVVYPSGRHLSAKVRAFVDLVVQLCAGRAFIDRATRPRLST